MIKIIAGKYKGRNIETPIVDSTKPTKNISRGGIFSAIGINIIDAVILDLFAGSAAFSIESLSRGARFAYVNDLNKDAYKVINKNFKTLNENNCSITNLDYLEALKKYVGIIFDIVFLDPPYVMDCYEDIINYLIDHKNISSKSIIVCETNRDLNFNSFENLYNIKRYKYGYSVVYILKGKEI